MSPVLEPSTRDTRKGPASCKRRGPAEQVAHARAAVRRHELVEELPRVHRQTDYSQMQRQM
jgi:hypothetical protein